MFRSCIIEAALFDGIRFNLVRLIHPKDSGLPDRQ